MIVPGFYLVLGKTPDNGSTYHTYRYYVRNYPTNISDFSEGVLTTYGMDHQPISAEEWREER